MAEASSSMPNANATQLRLDVRAPEMGGNFRFYYQNDFFARARTSGDMKVSGSASLRSVLRISRAEFTYGVWEDPDSWPDTVDYEGPNAVISSPAVPSPIYSRLE
jgi:hypothetical protein